MKRILAIFLVLMLSVGCCVMARAEQNDEVLIEEVRIFVEQNTKTVQVSANTLQDGLVAYFNGQAIQQENGVFTYISQNDQQLIIELNGDTAVCNLSKFNGLGKKYIQFINSDVCDANGDGISNIKDLIRTKKIIAGAASFDLEADFGGDGSVTVLDLVTVAKVLVSKKAGMPLYTVTYAQKTGKVMQTKLVAEGFGTLPDVDATKVGYDFIGWSAVAKNVTKNTKIYANYYPEDIFTEWPEGFE